MTERLLGGAIILCALAALAGCGGPRNCLVIPAQVEMLEERRTAALTKLENTARSVDRMQASIERVQARIAELQAQKGLLDSLITEPEEEGGR